MPLYLPVLTLEIWGFRDWRGYLFHNFLSISKSHRVNAQIRVPMVRLIDENDEQMGEVSIEEALKMALERELDLVEVAPLAKPPVCKLLDFGKFVYRQRKIEQKHKRMQKKTEMKTIRLSLRIDEHDLDIKANTAIKFFSEGNSVKVNLMFKGREAAHHDLGMQKVQAFMERVKDHCAVEAPAKRQGNSINMVLIPSKH